MGVSKIRTLNSRQMLCKIAMRHRSKCVKEKNFSNDENVTLLFWLFSGLFVLLLLQ